CSLRRRHPRRPALFPYTTLFRSPSSVLGRQPDSSTAYTNAKEVVVSGLHLDQVAPRCVVGVVYVGSIGVKCQRHTEVVSPCSTKVTPIRDPVARSAGCLVPCA